MLKTILRSSYGSTLRSFLLTIKIWLADAHSAKDGVAYWFRCHVRGLWVPFLAETRKYLLGHFYSRSCLTQGISGNVRNGTIWYQVTKVQCETTHYNTVWHRKTRHNTTYDTSLPFTTLLYNWNTLHYTEPNCTTQNQTGLHYTEPNCTTLNCITLQCTAIHYVELNYTSLHCTVLHNTTLPFPAQSYITLHYSTNSKHLRYLGNTM